jgi:YedE family putative selenium metabolism protein
MRLKIVLNDALWVAGAGATAGAGAAVLTSLGNPVDGGISIACFSRDMAGALGFHQVIEFSYLRPELIAIVFGAVLAAAVKGAFQPSGGSSTMLRFFIGMICSFGVFAFIGCPMRVGLRLAGGDPAAFAGLAGLIAGSGIGTLFLAKGFTLGKTSAVSRMNGLVFHCILALLFVFLITRPSFITLSRQRHAPLIASLAIGGLLGIAGQRTKLCFTGGFRNMFLIGDTTLLMGFVFLVLSAFLTNLALGQEHMGIHLIGSADVIWSFLALTVVGIASTFLGGCPFRQLILAAQGNTDSAITIMGIMAGAAISYNYYLAFMADSLDRNGKAAVLGGLIILIVIGLLNLKKT